MCLGILVEAVYRVYIFPIHSFPKLNLLKSSSPSSWGALRGIPSVLHAVVLWYNGDDLKLYIARNISSGDSRFSKMKKKKQRKKTGPDSLRCSKSGRLNNKKPWINSILNTILWPLLHS
jgi:hypothetical protein